MQVQSATSGGRVADAVRQHYQGLLSVYVRRVDGPNVVELATVSLSTIADDGTERPVEHGEYPREGADEIAAETVRIAREHAEALGPGCYEAVLTFARARKGTPKAEVRVQWYETPERADAPDPNEIFRSAWRDYHAANLETLRAAQEIIKSQQQAWASVTTAFASIVELQRHAGTNTELEIYKLQQQGEAERLKFAQSMLPMLKGLGGKPVDAGAPAANGPPTDPLLTNARKLARSIDADRRARLPEAARGFIEDCERAATADALREAFERRKAALFECFESAAQHLTEQQIADCYTLLEGLTNSAAA